MLGMTTSTGGLVRARNTFGTLAGQRRAVAGGRCQVSLVTWLREVCLLEQRDAAVAGQVRAGCP
jgi:hypothetical protein